MAIGGRANERLKWHLSGPSGEHVLNIVPSVFTSSVRVDVDGRTQLLLPKPTPRHPWYVGELILDDQTITVALSWAGARFVTGVLVQGRSISDNRTLAELQAGGPAPSSRYNSWFWRPTDFRIASWPLENLWHTVLVAGSVIALAVVPVPVQAVRVPAGLFLFATWFWWWFVLTARTHRYFMAHEELGDVRRVVAVTVVFFGYPMLWLGPVAIATLLKSTH